MKRRFVFPGVLVFFLCVAGGARAEVSLGSSREDVIKEFGAPSGTISSGEEEILSYPGGIIVLRSGTVSEMDDNFKQKLDQRTKENDFKRTQEKKGLVEYLGKWITKSEKQEIEKKEKKYSQTDPLIIISNGGQHVQLKDLLVQGKITIVDFFADWCGPCQAVAPYLERLARENDDIFLRKIDIVQWNTPVTRQYNIKSIPDIRVFDRNGRIVGKPTYNFQEVLAYVEQAIKHSR